VVVVLAGLLRLGFVVSVELADGDGGGGMWCTRSVNDKLVALRGRVCGDVDGVCGRDGNGNENEKLEDEDGEDGDSCDEGVCPADGD